MREKNTVWEKPLACARVFGSWSQFYDKRQERKHYCFFLFHPFTWSFQTMTTIHSSVRKRNEKCGTCSNENNVLQLTVGTILYSFPMHCCSLILSYCYCFSSFYCSENEQSAYTIDTYSFLGQDEMIFSFV